MQTRKIIVEIREEITEKYTEVKQFCTKEIPTGVLKNSQFESQRENLFEREYEVRDIEATRTRSVLLLKQEIEDSDYFDLSKVILAINGIGIAPSDIAVDVIQERKD